MTEQQLNSLIGTHDRLKHLRFRLADINRLINEGDIHNFQLLLNADRGFTGVFSISEAALLRPVFEQIADRIALDIKTTQAELDAMLAQITVPVNFGLPF
jgi:hypothetical protein